MENRNPGNGFTKEADFYTVTINFGSSHKMDEAIEIARHYAKKIFLRSDNQRIRQRWNSDWKMRLPSRWRSLGMKGVSV